MGAGASLGVLSLTHRISLGVLSLRIVAAKLHGVRIDDERILMKCRVSITGRQPHQCCA